MFFIPWGSRWWLGLTVNQFAAGSIPAYGAVAGIALIQELDRRSTVRVRPGLLKQTGVQRLEAVGNKKPAVSSLQPRLLQASWC